MVVHLFIADSFCISGMIEPLLLTARVCVHVFVRVSETAVPCRCTAVITIVCTPFNPGLIELIVIKPFVSPFPKTNGCEHFQVLELALG